MTLQAVSKCHLCSCAARLVFEKVLFVVVIVFYEDYEWYIFVGFSIIVRHFLFHDHPLLGLMHECLKRVVQRNHEVRVMDWRLDPYTSS